jgi:hypothetical protein
MSNTPVSAAATGLPEINNATSWAELDFEPWQHTEDGWKPPSNKEWNDWGAEYLPYVRIAWISMFKTKAELQVVIDDLGEECGIEMLDGFSRIVSSLKGVVEVVDAAEARIITAGMTSIEEEEADDV